jgi:Rod binding domain-containing protein
MNVSSISSLLASAPAPTPPVASSTANSAATTPAQRQKAAAQFEAILVRQLLDKSVGSMLGGSGHTAGMMYGDLVTNVLAQQLTAGKGLGLAKMMESQFNPTGSNAAKAAAKPVQFP